MPPASPMTNFRPTARTGASFIALVLPTILQQTEWQSGLFRPSRKSSKAPKKTLQELLMQYRSTPTTSGYSPSKLLNNRQLCAVIDTLLPSPFHIAESKLKSSNDMVNKTCHHFNIRDPCYALYFESGTTKILFGFLP